MTGRQLLAVLAVCVAGIAGGTYGISALARPGQAAVRDAPQVSVAPIDSVASSNSVPTGAPTRSTDALIRQNQARVKSEPSSADAYTNLALAYMQKERETSDVTYYQLTENALEAALRLDPKNYNAINYMAWVALGRHDFAQAAADARRAIQLDPNDAENYGTLGDAQANLGNYAAMLSAYQRMVDLKPSLASYNRASYARWLYGDLQGATHFMLLAIRAGGDTPENVAWCESQLGDDYFNAGFVLGAKQMYQAALRTFPHYAPPLAGLAMVEYSLGHPAAATRYYRQAIAIVPLPQYVTALGDLYARMGDVQDAGREYSLIRFIDHIFAINHVRYGIETAMFDADHNQNLVEALKIARAEAGIRDDVMTDDTLAWVLYKNGRYAQAWSAEQRALRLGTHYALFYFHAGMIQAKLGNVAEAQSYLHSALMLNPNFQILYASTARAELLRLGRLATSAPHAGGTAG